jgi:NADH dehydrogenase FAD-containing subunit
MTHVVAASSTIVDKLMNFSFSSPKEDNRKKVVVIGYGWAGKSFCDNINKKKYNVTVVSKTDYMLNTPKLKDSISYFDKKLLIPPSYKNLRFITDECKDINQTQSTIKTTNQEIKFDYLVVAVGSDTNDFGVNGVKENCYFLKDISDVQKLRIVFSKHKNIHDIYVTVLGAGPAGLELAFELSKTYKNIKIIEAMDKILPSFNSETSKLVIEELKNNKIELILNKKVTRVDHDRIYTEKSDQNNNYPLLTNITIWTCGIKPNALVKKLTNNKLTVNSNFAFSNSIYALGDIIASKELGPPTAQNATQQGRYLASHFNNDFKSKPYEYKEKGKIIHAANNMIIETQFGVFKVSNIFKPIIDYFIE